MERLNYRRVLWALHRSHLRHGFLLWVVLFAFLSVIVLMAAVTGAKLRLRQLDKELARARVQATQVLPAVTGKTGDEPALPLPSVAARFEINQHILHALDEGGFSPEEIRFKFEQAKGARLTRQVTSFSVRTHWNSIAQLLGKLQSADRSIYIARLKVSRDRASDGNVDAEIQLGTALLDDDAAAEVAP